MQLFLSALLTVLLCCGTLARSTPDTPTSPGRSPFLNMTHIIPQVKLNEIEAIHLKEDEGFKAAVLYLQGEEWKALVSHVLKSKEFEKFAEMTQKYKLNIFQLINCTETYVRSLKVVSTKVTAKPNLESFILDIQKALPIRDLFEALSHKDNPEARRVIEEIGSKENQKIFENLHNLPEMVKIRQILKGMSFDVEPYINLARVFLGWVH